MVPQQTHFYKSAVDVVVFRQQIHRLEQLVQIHQRSNDDQTSQYIPTPEGAGAKAVGNAAGSQVVADSCGKLMVPYNGVNAQSEPGENEGHQAKMHGLLAVIPGSDQVDIAADAGHQDNGIDAQGDDRQQNGFEQASVGFQFICGCRVFHVNLSFYFIDPFGYGHSTT